MPALIACPHCATIQTMPPPPERGHIECLRCGDILEHTTGRSIDAALACSLTALVLLFPANMLTIMTVRAPAGLVATTHLFSGIVTIWSQDWPLLATVPWAPGRDPAVPPLRSAVGGAHGDQA